MKNMSQGNAYDKYDLQDQLETAVTQLNITRPHQHHGTNPDGLKIRLNLTM
ncbi:MAG: hypothetical protein R3E31_11775 [Chloroflexota bacterium]